MQHPQGPYGPPPGYGYGPPLAHQGPRVEQQLFGEMGVVVTTARIIVGNTTFPMAGITAVHANKQQNLAGALLCGLLAFLCVFAAPTGLLFTLGLAAIAYWLGRPRHTIVIATAGTNAVAVESTNAAFVGRVLAAINNALTLR
jgi:hypothetical protein